MKMNILIGAMIIASFISVVSTAMADEDMVNGYLGTSGSVVMTSYGDCWRTSYHDTDDKKEACGYEKAVPVIEKPAPVEEPTKLEVVRAPTAVSATVKQMEKITIGANMLFGFDSAELSSDAKIIIMDRIGRFQGKGKLTSIMEVQGHTCSMGSESYNQTLSEKRAQAVADYIAENAPNVATNSINAVGMGESSPVASNDTEEGRMQNRRVEILAEAEIQK
ncbi:MAG: OmpA family protein [Candidatus Thiodiazotropha sp. (ex. Lucinoma kazani)]